MTNRDRVVHNVQNWEDLLKMSDPLAPKPADCTAENPLHIYLGRKVLTAAIKTSLAAIDANREALDVNDGLKAETAAMVAQREQLLAWLASENSDTVYVSLHPITEFELVDGAESAEPEEPEAKQREEWHDEEDGGVPPKEPWQQ